MPNNVFWGTHAALANKPGLGGPVAVDILAVGDSWFWYPFNNLAQEVGARYLHHDMVVIGNNGAEAAEWDTKYRKDIDFGFRTFAAGAKVLMLSGGGNDIAGMKDFLHIIASDCAGAASVQECYRTAEPEHLLTRIMGNYRALIRKFRAYNPDALVVLHQYDFAWPTGQGLFGPADWLKEPMDTARVPAALRHDLLKNLILALKDAQLALAQEPGLGPVRVASTAGVLPDDLSMWANELHPTPEGFQLLVKDAFVPVLKGALA